MINRILPTAIMLLCVVGCAHQPTAQEVQQTRDAAVTRGRARFNDELVRGNVTWYVTNGADLTGFNAATGLPEQLVSASTDEPMIEDLVKGHNQAVLDYLHSNGAVPGSFKPFVNQLQHQSTYFEMHQNEGVQTIKIGGDAAHSPGGIFTVTLRASGATGALITTAGPQIVVSGPDGDHQSPAPAGANGSSADVLFAPAGSNLAFTRWAAGAAPIYAALDLKNGRWLVAQH